MTMIDRDSVDTEQLVLPGRATALAWLAVSLACSDSADRLALYRSILIDIHPYGVTLAATDSYWLARAFVPFDNDFRSWHVPTLDEVPVDRFVLVDLDWRVRDLMRFIEKRTRGCDDPNKEIDDIDLVVTRNVAAQIDTDTPSLDPSLMAPKVFVEIPGAERIIVTESELGYPELGKILRFTPTAAKRLRFAPSKIQSVSQACQRVGSLCVQMNPTKGGAIAWSADFGDFDQTAELSGLLMPLRSDDEEDPV